MYLMSDTLNISGQANGEELENSEGTKTMPRFAIAALAASIVALPLASAALGATIGEREFMNSCAQCHGPDGSGDGVMAGVSERVSARLDPASERQWWGVPGRSAIRGDRERRRSARDH